MATLDEDVTLQELIVRALTGQDRNARSAVDNAAATDPELQQFCSELQDVVSMLAGSTDWRSAAPSAELTAKIRQAVVSKLPAAPPHFRTVMLEADLGRRRAARQIGVLFVIATAALAAFMYFSQRPQSGTERLELTGKLVFEVPLKGEPIQGFEFARETQWESKPEGLVSSGSEESGALYRKEPHPAQHALALNLDVSVPELDDGSSVTVFLADADGEKAPVFDSASRPRNGLAIEIAAAGLILNGPGHSLLQSKPDSNVGRRFYRIRLEHLGKHARVLVNGKVFFDGPLGRVFQGPLFAGMRAAGPKKNEIFFNALRIER